MKSLLEKSSILLFTLLFTLNGQLHSQSNWNAKSPMNPVALKYTSDHFGLKGPVKSVDQMLFNQEGYLIEENGDNQNKSYSYSKSEIKVGTTEYTFQYKLNEVGQITTSTILGLRNIISYSYDNQGNLISIIEQDGPNREETLFEYDKENRVVNRGFIYGEDTTSFSYNYYGDVEELEVNTMIVGDNSSRTTYYYKNGDLVNYKQMGVMQREDIKYDNHGNWIQYFSPVYGKTTTRTITYY